MSCLTTSSTFFKSDCRLSISCSSGLVKTALFACHSIDGIANGIGVLLAVCGTGSGARILATTMIRTAAATPVRLLAHQNENDFDSRCGWRKRLQTGLLFDGPDRGIDRTIDVGVSTGIRVGDGDSANLSPAQDVRPLFRPKIGWVV